MWNLKNDTIELIYKIEIDLQMCKTNIGLPTVKITSLGLKFTQYYIKNR